MRGKQSENITSAGEVDLDADGLKCEETRTNFCRVIVCGRSDFDEVDIWHRAASVLVEVNCLRRVGNSQREMQISTQAD